MQITSIEPFLEYYESVRGRTRRVLDRIPAEHLEWRPAPGKFSVGDIIRHLAGIERFMYAETVRGRPSRYAGHGPELASGRDAVFAYFDRLHAESLDIFRALTPAALAGKCVTPAGAPITVWKWLRAMLEHEVHHRGQVYLMLALLGTPTPPLYGLTEEEVVARSRRDDAGSGHR